MKKQQNVRAIKKRNESEAIISVQEAVQDFLASAEVKRLAKKTRDEYTYVLGVFAKWCDTHALVQNRSDKSWKAVKTDAEHGALSLHQVNDQAVYLFLEHLQQTHAPSKNESTKLSSATLVLYVKDIKRFLNWCLMDDLYSQHVRSNMVQRIKKPKLEEKIKETFSQAQIDALFRACDKEESEHLQVRDRAILSVLLDSGLRATELVTLTIENIHLDPKDAYVRVHGKGNKWGEVGLGEQARRAVQKYIRQFREPTIEYGLRQDGHYQSLPVRQQQQTKQQRTNQSLVFVNRSGKPLTRGGLLQLIVRLGEWSGVSEQTECHPHIFRHTFAATFIRNGGDIYTLSKLLRHSSVKVTEMYLKSIRQSEARKGVASVLDSMR
jgi:site-specific recombinase XerD